MDLGGIYIEGELIFLGFIMLAGQIIMLQMWNANWFKKENFKIQKTNLLAENKIKMRKLERELGLSISKEVSQPPTKLDQISQLSQFLPLLKNLDGDQIGALVDKFLGGEELLPAVTEGGGGGILDQIPPELIESFLKGLSKEKEAGEEGVKKTTGFTGQV